MQASIRLPVLCNKKAFFSAHFNAQQTIMQSLKMFVYISLPYYRNMDY